MANPKIRTGPMLLDWEVYAGDRNRETFEVTKGGPVDITGAVIEAQARLSAEDPTIAMTAVVVLIEPLLGRFTIAWPGEQVRALLAGQPEWKGVWDVQITEAGEVEPRTPLRGVFTAVLDVTRLELARAS